MTNKKRRWIWTGSTAAILIAGSAIALRSNRPPVEVEIGTARPHAVAPSILASGTLAYESEIKMVPEVIGRVREILVTEGDLVKQGQLLMRLDPATHLAEITQLDAARRQAEVHVQRQRVQLETLDTRWKRYQSLRGAGIVDANTYEEITSQRKLAEVELSGGLEALRQTEAQLAQARERLAKTEFRAPIDGTVTALFIKVGETAVPSAMSIAGSDVLVIANTDSLHAEINVDETDVARVGVGQRARIVPAATPDAGWEGRVERVAMSPRQKPGESKSYRVDVRLTPHKSIQFRSGMSCRAEIVTHGADVAAQLAVPIQAVRYEEDVDGPAEPDVSKASVFVATGDTVRRRRVETGLADDSHIVIRGGLESGERIVTGPAKILRTLRDGDRIAVAAGPAP